MSEIYTLVPVTESDGGVVYIPRTERDMQIIKNLGTGDQHKGLAAVFGLIVSVAIPFLAPGISGMIGLSGKLATAAGGWLSKAAARGIGSAIVGAGMGAINAKIAGTSVTRGALMGGIGAGARGYFTAGANVVSTGQALSQTAYMPAHLTGSTAANATLSSTGQALSQTAYMPAHLTGSTAVNAELASTGQVITANSALVNTAKDVQETGWFGSQLQKLGISKTDFAQTTITAGAQLLGTYIQTGQMTKHQKEILELRKQELASIKERDEAAFNQQLEGSKKLLQQASYYDPTNAGLSSANAQNMASGRVSEQNKRTANLTGRGYSSNDQRRDELNRSRLTGSAYSRGYNSGLSNQTNLIQAGLKSLPSGSTKYASELASLHKSYDDLAARNSAAATNFAELAGGLFPEPKEKKNTYSLVAN